MSPQFLRQGAVALTALSTLVACGKPPPAAAPPSVLVGTQRAAQRAVPDVLVAYGAVAPAIGTLQTLSLDQPAQVEAILVAPGAIVKAGERLLSYSLDPTAVSAYRQAQAALKLANAQQAHTSALFAQQLATRDQAAQAEAAVSAAQAGLAALAQQGAGVRSGGVAAPFDGVMVSIPVSLGDQTAGGAPLATIARTDGLVITAGFDAGVAAQLRPGQPVTVQSLSGGPILQRRVLRVAGALNPRTRLVDADIGGGLGGGLILGDAYRVTVSVGQVSGWIAPHVGVLNDGRADYVFQVSGGKARRIDVRVVRNAGDIDVVEGRLDPALPLVAEGAYQLEDGAQVRVAGSR